ncbi:MAG: protein translocase subunit SecD, partial [Pirellulaceae bacterium]|nr:protein translocase subunit SecD [Pirellulaceae bacterium]
MLDSLCQSLLWAQTQTTLSDGVFKVLYFIGVVLLVIVLPLVLGSMIARALRMRGYEWRLGLIFFTLAVSSWIVFRAYDFEKGKFRIPLGVDLKGGVILIYEIETGGGTLGSQAAEQAGEINMGDLMQALTNRINPSGTKEIVIRPYGDRQVEIIIPEVDAEEVRNIKQQISTAGSLEFRIVANTRDHRDIIALAEEQAQDPDAARRVANRVMRGNEPVAFWAEAAKEKLRAGELAGNILRNSATGEMVDLQSLGPIRDAQQSLDDYLAENGLENVDVLVATDDGCDVTGDNLGMVSASVDEYLAPCVNFRLRGVGVSKFQLLTSSNLPDTDSTPPFYRHLGIILDERLISFPRLITTISDSGRITGNFSQEEVDFLVGILRAGKLPASLQKVPISENQIGSMLGDDTIQKGKTSIAISLVAVLIFTAVYYRFCGLVACGALLANLLFIFATMILLNAPLTLPGLAGLVLTVGMSIDANVLIFERMREELQHGAALRMAIRNGFDKATTTIVDSNLTTLISAVVLYWIGTDQIRGFAVTLILGILMSMFTAVFCARVVFDIAERRRWITQLRMMQFLGSTNVDFIGKRNLCIAGSVVLILIGLAGVVMRGKSIFDIDFTGGVSVTMVLRDSMPPDEVRGRLDSHFRGTSPPIKCSVNTVSVEGRPSNSVYKVDANLDSTAALEAAIETVFRSADGQNLLLTYEMAFADVKAVALAPSGIGPGSPSSATGKSIAPSPAPAAPDQPAPDQPAPDQPAPDQPAPDQPAPDQPAPDQ